LIRNLEEVEIMTGHYMFCLAVSRFLRLIFWVMLYYQGDSFVYLIVADLIHTLLLADFSYYYLKYSRGPSILLH
jgi:ER lumen protein retaining receptor